MFVRIKMQTKHRAISQIFDAVPALTSVHLFSSLDSQKRKNRKRQKVKLIIMITIVIIITIIMIIFNL